MLPGSDHESPKAEVGASLAGEPTCAANALRFEQGALIHGRYELQEEVGVGGLGAVWSARHLGLDGSVALKFLKPELANHPEAVSRFNAEARACFVLRSEHVVRVLDVDSYQGVPFIVMELLHGIDLRRALSTAPAIEPEVAVDYALQVCEGLCAAHASGIIHRDIKPENLFLHGYPADCRIKVLDFGISQLMAAYGHEPSRELDAEAAAGTPPYMSPEQLSAATVDARSDVWSLGCVLYELLSGVAPFERETVQESCDAVRTLDPPALSSLRPTLPPALCEVVERCLRKDPAQRYRDAAQLAAALAPHGSGTFDDYPERCRAQLANERRSVPELQSALARAPKDAASELGPELQSALARARRDDARELLPEPSISAMLSATSLREAVAIGKRLIAAARAGTHARGQGLLERTTYVNTPWSAELLARLHGTPKRGLWVAAALLAVIFVWTWTQHSDEPPHIVTPSEQQRPVESGASTFAQSESLPLGAADAVEQGQAEPKELEHSSKRRRQMNRPRYHRRHAQREPDVGF